MSRKWSIFIAFLLATLLSGCAAELYHDAISTRLEVPVVDVALDQEFVESKRFRFERDVQSAKNAYIDHGWVQVLSPEELDLSFLSSVDIYAIDPATEERVLILEGVAFLPGEDYAELQVVFPDDVRHFIADQRVNMEWVVSPHRLFEGWDGIDLAELQFGIVVAIDAE